MKLYAVMDPVDSRPLGIFDSQEKAKQCAVKIYDYTGLGIYIEEYELNKTITFELKEDNVDTYPEGPSR